MKNLTKKRGFLAASAALLIVLAMLGITWCSNDIGSGEFTPPEGKGAVKLTFNQKIARTILPDGATLSALEKFDFQFTPTSGGTAKLLEQLNYSTSPGTLGTILEPIILDPGTYDLEVIAYISNTEVATGSAAGIIITPAKTTSATIALKPYDQATGSGTFNYQIISTILESDVDSATMNLTNISTVTLVSSVDLIDSIGNGTNSVWNDGDNHNLPVDSGDYYLDFVVKVITGETVKFRHIVHIYHNLTSSYVFTIEPDYFNAVFQLISSDLSYVHPDDVLPVLEYDSTALTEGETVTVRKGDSVTITVSNTFASYEWYSQDDTSLSASSSYTVNTASGKFNEKKTYLLTVVGVTDTKKYYTYIYIKVIEGSPLLSSDGTNNNLADGATLKLTQGNTQTITVVNSSMFDSYEWYINGGVEAETSNTYAVDTSTAGTYVLKAEGIKDGKSYYTTITIIVE